MASLISLASGNTDVATDMCLEQLANTILIPAKIHADPKNSAQIQEYKRQLQATLKTCSSNSALVQNGDSVAILSGEAAEKIRQARDQFINRPRQNSQLVLRALREIHALIIEAQSAQAKTHESTASFAPNTLASPENTRKPNPVIPVTVDASGDSSIDFGSYRLSPVHIVDATLPSGNDITDASVFGQYAVSFDLSNLLQQKAAAKRMLYARGYVPQPHKPLFVFSSTMTQCSNVDVLPEIASEILSLGGQLVVVANCGYFFYPKGADKLLELRDSYSRTLKIYTNSYTISLPFRDTAVSNLDMIFFAADYMITAETSPTTQDDASPQTQVFPTVESALIHWQSLHGE